MPGPLPGTWQAGRGYTETGGGQVVLSWGDITASMGPEEAESVSSGLAVAAREARASNARTACPDGTVRQ